MKISTSFVLIFFLSLTLTGQKADYLWHFGQNSQDDIEHAGIVLSFFDDTLSIYSEFRTTFFTQVNSSFCDSIGNAIFYTNGLHVANSLGQIMDNGSNLNPGEAAEMWSPYGYSLSQGAISLQYPELDSLFFIFHMDVEFSYQPVFQVFTGNFYYSLIDISENDGLGKVVVKNNSLINSELAFGKLTTVRHGNGRDWWILVRGFGSNEFFRFLVSNKGVKEEESIMVGDSIPSSGLGQAIFSPDGNKYVYVNLVGQEGDPIFVNIYDFDRCEGLLYNPVQFTYSDSARTLGAAISSNSRFLYLSSYSMIYQYDLWAEDIESTKDTVAIYDGFLDSGGISTRFYLAQLAPDGKIYINSPNSTKHLHVINYPDLPGNDSDVCQHCIELPGYNSFSLPNFPNYRLQHLESSPCDTLREPPTASFEYDTDGLTATFTSTSMHDIRTWYWTFGDGTTDTLINPTHGYEEEGVYEVCLTVTNPRGEDTYCEQVAVLIDDVEDFEENKEDLRLFPNPSTGSLEVSFPKLSESSTLMIYDQLGRLIRSWPLASHAVRFNTDLPDLPSGMYWVRLQNAEGELAKKLIIER